MSSKWFQRAALCGVLLLAASQGLRDRKLMAGNGYVQHGKVCARIDELTSGLEVLGGVAALFGPAGAAIGAGVAVSAWAADVADRYALGCS